MSIALEPHFVKPKMRKASALRSEGKWPESFKVYTAVLQLEPSCAEAREGLGYCAPFVEV